MFSVVVFVALIAFVMWYVPREYRKQQEIANQNLREYFALYKNEEAQKMMRAAGYKV